MRRFVQTSTLLSLSLSLPRTLASLTLPNKFGTMASSTSSSSSSSSSPSKSPITYISAESAAALDIDLMTPVSETSSPLAGGFSLPQLMELAGLAVAEAVLEAYPPDKAGRVLFFCGPGNNGGDGLVAARHLKHFNYPHVTIVFPKLPRVNIPHFQGLVKQCKDMGVEFVEFVDADADSISLADVDSGFDLVVDGVFGFSFSGDPRPPFATILQTIYATKTPVLSIDLPSGYDVNLGDVRSTNFIPSVLISLTAPKLGVKGVKFGRHFVGMRVLGKGIKEEYGIVSPVFERTSGSQIVEIFGTGVGDNEECDV